MNADRVKPPKYMFGILLSASEVVLKQWSNRDWQLKLGKKAQGYALVGTDGNIRQKTNWVGGLENLTTRCEDDVDR